MPTEIEIRDGRLQALQSRDAEIERLRAALNTARDYIKDDPLRAAMLSVRGPTLLQVIDDALGVEQKEPT